MNRKLPGNKKEGGNDFENLLGSKILKDGIPSLKDTEGKMTEKGEDGGLGFPGKGDLAKADCTRSVTFLLLTYSNKFHSSNQNPH